MKPKYAFEIDVSDHTSDDYGCWANYGLITAEGNNLDELLESAMVDVIDQDGGELDICVANSSWMQDLIEIAYKEAVTNLKSKQALCRDCGNVLVSHPGLPLFSSTLTAFDTYYCGCRGWD